MSTPLSNLFPNNYTSPPPQLNTNIYNQSPLTLNNQSEYQYDSIAFNEAQNANATGTIPGLGFQQGMVNTNPTGRVQDANINRPRNPGTIRSELTGQDIANTEWHDNQVPSVGSGVKQNTDPYAYATKLEHFTGQGATTRPRKQEVGSFYDHSPMSGGFVNGAPAMTSYDLESRYAQNTSRYRNGEKIFQEVRVGPALNAGYGTEGHGGFQQNNALEFARAYANRTINNRLPNNPKISYTLPINPGALRGGTRGLQAAVRKNKPERWYRNDPGRYFITGGAVKASKLRERVNAKATKRQNHRSYYGGLGNAAHKRPKMDPSIRKSRRENLMNDWQHGVFHEGAWIINDEANDNAVGDYGMNAIENRPNERDITGTRIHRLNVSTNVKKLIMPFTDILRRTKKENAIGNIRPEGFMSPQIPSKQTVYDPNDTPRTTKKELNIHNNHEGFLAGPNKHTVHDPNDVPGTTKKELNIHNNHEGFLSGPDRLQVYDPNDIPRATKKDMNIHNTHEGFLSAPDKGQVYDPNDTPRTTRKELNIHTKAPFINLSPQQPPHLRVYDPEDIARTTKKELIEDNNHMGFVQFPEDTHPGAYTSVSVSAKNTNKQFLVDYYYTGAPSGEVGKGGGRGYLASKVKARNTNRQFTGDHEYQGTASHYTTGPKSYSSAYNMRLNPNKEQLARGRAPTEQREKLPAGVDFVNVQHKKIESDYINTREPMENRVYGTPPQANHCGVTSMKQKLSDQVSRDRLDPDLLNAFRDNPYTQSLTSAV